MEYLVHNPDKTKTKALMEHEKTMPIGSVTKRALALMSSVETWVLSTAEVTLLQPWLKLAQRDAKEEGKDVKGVLTDVKEAIHRARMLLSILNAWNVIMVKVNSKKIISGEESKSTLIKDCKARIKKVDCLTDIACVCV